MHKTQSNQLSRHSALMFVKEAAMLIRLKQATQKVKANFKKTAETQGGKAKSGTLREDEKAASLAEHFYGFCHHSFLCAAFIPQQTLQKNSVLTMWTPQHLAVSGLFPGCSGSDQDKISASACPKTQAEWTKCNLRKYNLRCCRSKRDACCCCS